MTDIQNKIKIMTEGHDDIPLTMDIRCKNCIYCKSPPWEKSICRALPPYFQEDGWDGYKRWPTVDKDEDWCGKFKPRTESIEQNRNDDSSALRYALERINEGIVRTGPNTIGTSLNLVEIKTIAETALGITESK